MAALGDGATVQTGIDDHRDTVLAQLLGYVDVRFNGAHGCAQNTQLRFVDEMGAP
jgi:hypothetical protein